MVDHGGEPAILALKYPRQLMSPIMGRVKYTKYVCTLGIIDVEAFISLGPVVLGSLSE